MVELLKRFGFVIFILFFLLSHISNVQAQEITPTVEGESVREYSVDIGLFTDGIMRIKETVVRDFDDAQRHGIMRNINYLRVDEQTGKKYKFNIDNITVTDARGEAIPFTRTDGEQVSLKIGDPNKTTSGVNTYVISYEVTGFLTDQEELDELFWNIIPHDIDVPVLSARGFITLPDQLLADARVKCYSGPYQSDSTECSIMRQDDGIEITPWDTLQPGEGLTVVVGVNKNVIRFIQPEEVVGFTDTPFGNFLMGMLIVTAILFAVIWYIVYPIWIPVQWFMYGRDPDVGKAPTAWYDPPKTKSGRSLTPAEVGTLIDEIVHYHDITAMIIDLARRGYISIVEKKKGEFHLEKKKEGDSAPDLLPFEKKFLTGLFKSSDSVDLKKTNLYKLVTDVAGMIYQNMIDEDFFPHHPKRIRTMYHVLTGLGAATLNIPLVISSVLFGRAMPRKTHRGSEACNHVKGLKNFLQSQERQLEFQSQNQMYFEQLLPFAVAFGVEKVWAKRFKDIEIKPPEWYQGYDSGKAFNSAVLVNGISRSTSQLSHSASSSTGTSSTRSSFSSGFSGGFSGGGGGGGSMSSW